MSNQMYNFFGSCSYCAAFIALSSILFSGFCASHVNALNESFFSVSVQPSNKISAKVNYTINNSITGNNSEDNSAIIMTTDKTVYSPGEIVNVTISNTGDMPIVFPNSALGLTIRSVETNETYPIFSAQVITSLNPNDSRSVTWDQTGLNGNQVPAGDYIASLGSGIASDEVAFSIS